jgi:hypothetical protein
MRFKLSNNVKKNDISIVANVYNVPDPSTKKTFVKFKKKSTSSSTVFTIDPKQTVPD